MSQKCHLCQKGFHSSQTCSIQQRSQKKKKVGDGKSAPAPMKHLWTPPPLALRNSINPNETHTGATSFGQGNHGKKTQFCHRGTIPPVQPFPSCSTKEWDLQHPLERQGLAGVAAAHLGWQQHIWSVTNSQGPPKAPNVSL